MSIAANENAIPPMTNELGKHWDAPDRSKISMSLKFAWMDKRDFESLHEYSNSNPTGVYAGKMWKSLMRFGNSMRWVLMWYGKEYMETKGRNAGYEVCKIHWLRIGINP